MADTLKQVLDSLSRDVELVVKQVWKNSGLKSNSNLLKSISVETGINNQLVIYAADYAKYYSEGRKKFSRKIPLDALISYIKKNNFQSSDLSVNQLAFIIQRSIYLHGISAKNVIASTEGPVINITSVNLEKKIYELLDNEILKNKKY